jgi:hypothetical protein
MDMYTVNKRQVGCQAAFASKPAPTGSSTPDKFRSVIAQQKCPDLSIGALNVSAT